MDQAQYVTEALKGVLAPLNDVAYQSGTHGVTISWTGGGDLDQVHQEVARLLGVAHAETPNEGTLRLMGMRALPLGNEVLVLVQHHPLQRVARALAGLWDEAAGRELIQQKLQGDDTALVKLLELVRTELQDTRAGSQRREILTTLLCDRAGEGEERSDLVSQLHRLLSGIEEMERLEGLSEALVQHA